MNRSSKKGFTIIETLVAVTILMIAIAGPLTAAMKAYTAALDARNQTVAMYLAQGTLETVSWEKDVDSVLPPGGESAVQNSIFTITKRVTPIDADEVKVKITASWNAGKITNSLSLQEIFTRYQR